MEAGGGAEAASTGQTPLYYSFPFHMFMGLLNVGMSSSLIFVTSLEALFLLWIALSSTHVIIFILSVMCSCYLMFLMSDRERVNLERGGGEEMEGVEGGETLIRTYCVRKEPTFNKRGAGISK